MISIRDNKQLNLFDPWAFLSAKRRRMLDEDWPGLFRKFLLDELPVNEMRRYFCENFGRPSKELYSVMGILLFQQTMNLTDKETTRQAAFNIEWHYALNITEESDSAKYISEKTLWSMRQKLMESRLDQLMFERISKKLGMVFKVDFKNQRIDSMHIKSNMRRLGRIGIFSQAIHKFLVNLKRHHRALFDAIPQGVVERYLTKKAMAAFSMVKPSESHKTLNSVSRDLFDLIKMFKDQAEVGSMQSYKLMQRVLEEQCELGDDGVAVKPASKIPADSLQNPSDPDAGYSGHKGQGYQVQVMETFTTTTDPKKKEETLNLITHVAVESACEHDSKALIPAIEETRRKDLKPENLTADSLYGCDENVQAADAAGVELIAPVMNGGKQNDITLKDFEFDDTGCVSCCPAGHKPKKVKQKANRFRAHFNRQHCMSCRHVDQCPVHPGKRGYYLRYTAKDYRLAKRRAFEQTDEFIEAYRWRAGVEATMSEYAATTGVKHLRVRGMKAVRFCATLKAIGVNIRRAVAVAKARRRNGRDFSASKSGRFMPFPIFKERFASFCLHLADFLPTNYITADSYGKLAA